MTDTVSTPEQLREQIVDALLTADSWAQLRADDRERLADAVMEAVRPVVDALAAERTLGEQIDRADQAEAERDRIAEQVAEGPHLPTVARLASGEWGVCCIACSNKAGDHVPRCLINADGWPPLTLIRAVPGSSLLESKAAAQAADLDGPAGGEPR